MGRYKYLLKNLGLLTLSSFATKFLSFFLVPLYTNILSTAEYGIFELVITTTAILLPVLTLNIQEAVFRFAIDQEFSRKAIVTVSSRYIILSNAIVFVLLLVNSFFSINGLIKDYSIFFFAVFLVSGISDLMALYVRGIGKISDLSVAGVLSSLVTIVCNIVFLVVFRWGITGYFLAHIAGMLSQSVFFIIRVRVFDDIDLKGKYHQEKEKMLAYSKPMIANSVGWWVNNLSDKYIVTWCCGLSENGIYSVASKIPSILNVFQNIFAQAWTLSAVKDFDPEDKDGFFADTYSAYNCFMVIICSVIIAADRILAKFLYAKDFYPAWRYVPWLTVAIVFGSLAGYLGGFFSAVKDSKIFARSTIAGSFINVVLNLCLTPWIGALGAAAATTVCYFAVWLVRIMQSKKIIKMRINLVRDVISYLMLTIQSVILLFVDESLCLYVLEIGIMFLIAIMYIKDIVNLMKKGLQIIEEKKR